MAQRTSVMERLDSVEQRLGAAASQDPPPGLTDPDPGGEERWEARQVWALRLRLPAESHAAYDALPVPVRRQLATLADEVFLPTDADGRARAAG